MAATLGRDEDGGLERKASVMGIVLAGGEVRAGDPVRVEPPSEPSRARARPEAGSGALDELLEAGGDRRSNASGRAE